ncbi:hypothetical protein ULG90_16530 [Halopseudomonas pachastrellae]|nr:hypothetical protein ULG90_16530 [Halopseudomonas pachastrellae]
MPAASGLVASSELLSSAKPALKAASCPPVGHANDPFSEHFGCLGGDHAAAGMTDQQQRTSISAQAAAICAMQPAMLSLPLLLDAAGCRACRASARRGLRLRVQA